MGVRGYPHRRTVVSGGGADVWGWAMAQAFRVGVAVLVIGLLLLVAGITGVAFDHLVVPVVVLVVGAVVTAVGWRGRAGGAASDYR